jgi:endonuclease/exonuclease/phosphatase family metal-dependent hydrolase
MTCIRLKLCAFLALATLPACTTPRAAPLATLTLATWNLEWLVTPATFNQLRGSCTRDGVSRDIFARSLPCDVVAKLERSASDFAGLARYAERLDADVIALQETDGPAAARQVFRAHAFCFTGGTEVQNTGFAIRRGIAFRCGRDLKALALGDTLRRGAELILYPDTPQELHLLSVHLKSGCARPPLDSGQDACARLARQAPVLAAWIAAEAAAGRRFVVMGDFNRDLLAEQGPERDAAGRLRNLWPVIDGLDCADGGDDLLFNTARGARFNNCSPGQAHTGFIDYILTGTLLASAVVPGSFAHPGYAAQDAWRLKLSDHCPATIRLQLTLPLS